jgi:hypothetical protein
MSAGHLDILSTLEVNMPETENRPENTALRQRLYILEPVGTCDEAEAARTALRVYGNALAVSYSPSLRRKGRAILDWIDAEDLAAGELRTINETMA